jgi:hypothetical protein
MGRGRLDPHSASDVADTTNALLVGGGLITMVLFPLALPILALTAVALLPFLLPPLVVVLAIALLALPVLLVRGVLRLASRALRRPDTAERSTTPAQQGA